MIDWLDRSTRHLFFTGKGGVGKTALACATAIALAERGKRVLLVSTDPASNLDEMLSVKLTNSAADVPGVEHLSALNIEPDAAAEAYRRRVLAPYQGVKTPREIDTIREQLSGACTTEIAAFDEFAALLAGEDSASAFDHVVFDTAPTSHTLLLLDATGAYHRDVMRGADLNPPSRIVTPLMRLRDSAFTKVLIVTLAETTPVSEAAQLQDDLRRAGVEPYAWIINSSLAAAQPTDPLLRRRAASDLAQIARVRDHYAKRVFLVPLVREEPVGPERLRALTQWAPRVAERSLHVDSSA